MENHQQQLCQKIWTTVQSFRIAGTEFRAKDIRMRESYANTINALSVFLGLLLDGTAIFASDLYPEVSGRVYAGASRIECDLTRTFEELDAAHDALLEWCVHHHPFKGDSLDACIRAWPATSNLTRLTKGVALQWVKTNHAYGVHQAFLVQWLSTITTFFKKLNVDRPDLEAQAQDDFLAFEEELHCRAQDGPSTKWLALTQRMSHLLRSTYDCEVHGPFVPRHGPGVVADTAVHCKFEKYTRMVSDTRIDYLLRSHDLAMTDFNPYIKKGLDRTNRFISVPKNWKKRRTISAEPAGLQYFQQALRRELYERLEADPWWGARVKFSDQSRSRDLAQASSLTGTYATIDLSAASDSVTLALVKRVFGNTELSRWLLATRSVSTMVSNTLLSSVQKFAPMGSAVCFPVETMIFTLVAELAIRDSITPVDVYRCPVVYGDDIIVPFYATDLAIEYLNVLGFSVNTDKSYTTGFFREACGMEAWGGFDVTPLRYKQLCNAPLHAWRRMTYEERSRLIDLVNQLELLGAHTTSRNLLAIAGNCQLVGLRATQSVGWDSFQFSADPQCIKYGLLYTPGDDTNYRLKSRWLERGLQRREYRMSLHVKRPNDVTRKFYDTHYEEVELLQYMEWLISHQVQDDIDDVSSSFCDPVPPEPYRLVEMGYTMVPTQKWVGSWECASYQQY